MKTTLLISSLLLVITFGFTNCSKECVSEIATCSETPPQEACDAYFSRWFYNKDARSCEQINYSGCSEKGFATEEECEACKCD